MYRVWGVARLTWRYTFPFLESLTRTQRGSLRQQQWIAFSLLAPESDGRCRMGPYALSRT